MTHHSRYLFGSLMLLLSLSAPSAEAQKLSPQVQQFVRVQSAMVILTHVRVIELGAAWHPVSLAFGLCCDINHDDVRDPTHYALERRYRIASMNSLGNGSNTEPSTSAG
jgi:hypothetical protein